MDSSSSSDEELVLNAVVTSIAVEAHERQCYVGGKPGKRPNILRGPCSWWSDYLVPQPRYRPSQFRHRFRVPLKLFRRLEHDLPSLFPDLQQKTDAVGRNGAASWQKILVSLRRLGEGSSFESLDDQARMSGESIRRAFRAFCYAVRTHYGSEFLNRVPSIAELRATERKFASRSLPGCVGSVDCMSVKWKNCPKSWKGQYHNPRHGKLAGIYVEAMCDSDLYCWHLHVGPPGTNNDLKVAENSPLFISILNGSRAMKLPEGYMLNGIVRDWHLYYLVDGIYPPWSIFLKPIHAPINLQQQVMTAMYESRRKDVERLFGVLQGRFRILTSNFNEWSDTEVIHIVETCTILHNMLVRLVLGNELSDEEDSEGNPLHPNQIVSEFYYDIVTGYNEEEYNSQEDANPNQTWIEALLGSDTLIRDPAAHNQLRDAVTSHIWASHGNITIDNN